MSTKSIDPSIILASGSSRRKSLLRQAGLPFSVIPSHIDENTIHVELPEAYVKTLAEAKADDVASQYPDSWIIAADTIVLINGNILGKPETQIEATTMLDQLSGKIHQVFTGFCIMQKSLNHRYAETVKTDVEFKRLTNEEIQWYTQTIEPYDKAGGYGIQGLGAFLIKNINGSYTNVVGLPVCEVLDYLLKKGIITLTELGKSRK